MFDLHCISKRMFYLHFWFASDFCLAQRPYVGSLAACHWLLLFLFCIFDYSSIPPKPNGELYCEQWIETRVALQEAEFDQHVAGATPHQAECLGGSWGEKRSFDALGGSWGGKRKLWHQGGLTRRAPVTRRKEQDGAKSELIKMEEHKGERI